MPERGSSGEGTSHEASSDVPPPRQLFRSMEGNVARPGTDDAKDATGEHVSTTSSVIPSSNRSAQDPSTSSSCHHEKTTGMEIVDSVANLSLPQLSSSIDSAPSVNPAHNLEPNVQLLRSILDRLPPTLLETIFTHRSFDAEDNYDNLNMYTPSSMEKALENIIQQRYPELSSSDKSVRSHQLSRSTRRLSVTDTGPCHF
ncbi:hypothetical protein BDY24DRAFT_30551 [Mrakia frigida]|uniref:uncharacterized protein n=1 Tax=Mrakia frigida TaxID=29902 RepID=UPI003FCC19D1